MTTPSAFTPQQVTAAIRAGLPNHASGGVSAADAGNFAATYQDNLAHYREHVRQSLADGDYRQAAEKSWGLYAQSIKIIGADHGFHIASHRSIVQVSGHLTALAGRSDATAAQNLTAGLAFARSLHQHFYENDLPPASVTASVGQVFDAIDQLQALFASNGTGGWNGDTSCGRRSGSR